MILYDILAFLAGLLIGSFLNVCVFRLPRDLSVANPRRSFCPECAIKKFDALDKEILGDQPPKELAEGEEPSSPSFDNPVSRAKVFAESTIAWYDNIPLASYLMLGGRCRRCGTRIPARYPLVELATGACFAFAVFKFGLTLLAFKYAIFATILIMLIASDAEERILPDEFTKGGIAIGLVLAWFLPSEPLFGAFFVPRSWGAGPVNVFDALLGALVPAGAIWVVARLYQRIRHRDGMGLGDVKMIAMVGAFLGLRWALGTLILASLAGALLGFGYIKLTGKDTATYELPFGSFIGAAAWFVATFRGAISV